MKLSKASPFNRNFNGAISFILHQLKRPIMRILPLIIVLSILTSACVSSNKYKSLKYAYEQEVKERKILQEDYEFLVAETQRSAVFLDSLNQEYIIVNQLDRWDFPSGVQRFSHGLIDQSNYDNRYMNNIMLGVDFSSDLFLSNGLPRIAKGDSLSSSHSINLNELRTLPTNRMNAAPAGDVPLNTFSPQYQPSMTVEDELAQIVPIDYDSRDSVLIDEEIEIKSKELDQLQAEIKKAEQRLRELNTAIRQQEKANKDKN